MGDCPFLGPLLTPSKRAPVYRRSPPLSERVSHSQGSGFWNTDVTRRTKRLTSDHLKSTYGRTYLQLNVNYFKFFIINTLSFFYLPFQSYMCWGGLLKVPMKEYFGSSHPIVTTPTRDPNPSSLHYPKYEIPLCKIEFWILDSLEFFTLSWSTKLTLSFSIFSSDLETPLK